MEIGLLFLGMRMPCAFRPGDKMGSARHSRGQLFSTDALLSLVVFAFVLALVTSAISQLVAQGDASIRAEYRELSSQNLVYFWLNTGGEPSYWENLSDRNSVLSVGLSDSGGGLSYAKWLAFTDWNADDYHSLKLKMGLLDQNFMVKILDVNKNSLYSVGISPVDRNEVHVHTWPSSLNGSPVFVQVQVYP